MKPTCIKCSKNITDIRFPGLGCASCGKVYHQLCANLSKEAFNSIAKKDCAWSCGSCKNKSTTRKSGIFPPIAPSSSATQQATTGPTLEKRLIDLAQAFNEYKDTTDARISQLETLLEARTKEVALLSGSIEKVETKAEELAHQSATDFLDIQGIPEDVLSAPDTGVLSLATEIGCDLSSSDFDCSVDYKNSKPTIEVKFKSREKRRNFLLAGKRFNREKKRAVFGSTSCKIFVNEHLTSDQKKLLYNTKLFARENNYNFAWFCNGVVHLKKHSKSRLIIIESQTVLDNLPHDDSEILLPERQRTENEDERTSPRRSI